MPVVRDPSQLHVVVAITNSCRYSTRYHLFEKFEKMVLDSGARLWVAEAAFGHRPHAVTSSTNPQHIQLRTSSEIWHKENLLNLAIQRLPSDWEYVAWIDPDIAFARPDWVNETINQLQHFDVVQMFSQTHDLNDKFDVIRTYTGFLHCYCNGEMSNSVDPKNLTLTDYFQGTRALSTKQRPYYAHPGYAWAARRRAIDDLGGLIDWAILGSADYYMANALVGRAASTVVKVSSPAFRDLVLEWEKRAEKYIRRNVGVVPGAILHFWHGRKKDRRYQDRNAILLDNGFDPHIDLKKDSQGLWQLTDRSIGLRDGIRGYFRSRNEDSITE